MPLLAAAWACVNHINFKIAATILFIALVWLGCFSWIKLHDAKVRAEATAKATAACPPQVRAEAGSHVNIERASKMWCIPLPAVAHFGLGFCHD